MCLQSLTFLLDVYYVLDTADKYSLLSYKSEPKYQISDCPTLFPFTFLWFLNRNIPDKPHQRKLTSHTAE